MSAPTPNTPPTDPPRRGLTPARLLGAVAFAALGFVVVWQGFGAAGLGTDAHALRVVAAVGPLFACGLLLVWPRVKLPIRALAALVGLGAAGAVWWLVPADRDAPSLRDAVALRDELRGVIAKPAIDDYQHTLRAKHPAEMLTRYYPSMLGPVGDEHRRWADAGIAELRDRYRKLTPDDLKGVLTLRLNAHALDEVSPGAFATFRDEEREWVARAQRAKTDELFKLAPGDWAGFDRTAPGRRSLGHEFSSSGGARDALIRAEAEWVDSTVESIVANKLGAKRGEAPPARDFWLRTQAEILALDSLDRGDGRFAKARLRLFVVAHREAQSAITARLEAGEYDVAYGLTRKHAVDWHATATALGGDELKKLDDLRATCAAFAAFAAKAAPPPEAIEVAPAPAAKPEVAPEPRPKPEK